MAIYELKAGVEQQLESTIESTKKALKWNRNIRIASMMGSWAGAALASTYGPESYALMAVPPIVTTISTLRSSALEHQGFRAKEAHKMARGDIRSDEEIELAKRISDLQVRGHLLDEINTLALQTLFAETLLPTNQANKYLAIGFNVIAMLFSRVRSGRLARTADELSMEINAQANQRNGWLSNNEF